MPATRSHSRSYEQINPLHDLSNLPPLGERQTALEMAEQVRQAIAAGAIVKRLSRGEMQAMDLAAAAKRSDDARRAQKRSVQRKRGRA